MTPKEYGTLMPSSCTLMRSALRPLPLYTRSGRDFWNNAKEMFVESCQHYNDRLLAEDFWG